MRYLSLELPFFILLVSLNELACGFEYELIVLAIRDARKTIDPIYNEYQIGNADKLTLIKAGNRSRWVK